MDAGDTAPAQHVPEPPLQHFKRSRHQTSCRRRCRQFICKPRAHRAGHGRGRFPGRIQAAGLSYGKSPGRSSDQKRCEMDLHQPCWGFSARRSKNWKIYSGREELVRNAKGESVISYADYAIAVVDEAVKGNHIQQRISVVAE